MAENQKGTFYCKNQSYRQCKLAGTGDLGR